MADLIDFAALQQVLGDLARDIRTGYREELERNDRYTTERGLIDSVQTRVIAGEKEYLVTMSLRDYWKYVEEGTRPHWPPVSAIQRWVEIKPVLPRPMDNGKLPTPKQLAFLISRKISRVGTEGSHDLAKTKDAIIPAYRERISAALGRDMENYIRKVVAGK